MPRARLPGRRSMRAGPSRRPLHVRGNLRLLFLRESSEQRAHELLRVRARPLVSGEQPLREDLVGGPEEDPHGEARVEVLAELAAGDAVAQHVAEDAKVLDELAPGEALDEAGAAAKLDLEDRGEVAVRADELEVEVDEGGQALGGRRLGARHGTALLEDVVHRLVEDDAQEVFLVAEIEVDGALRDPRVRGDVRDAGLVKPPAAEDANGGLQDAAALLGIGARGRPLRGREGGDVGSETLPTG